MTPLYNDTKNSPSIINITWAMPIKEYDAARISDEKDGKITSAASRRLLLAEANARALQPTEGWFPRKPRK